MICQALPRASRNAVPFPHGINRPSKLLANFRVPRPPPPALSTLFPTASPGASEAKPPLLHRRFLFLPLPAPSNCVTRVSHPCQPVPSCLAPSPPYRPHSPPLPYRIISLYPIPQQVTYFHPQLGTPPAYMSADEVERSSSETKANQLKRNLIERKR